MWKLSIHLFFLCPSHFFSSPYSPQSTSGAINRSVCSLSDVRTNTPTLPSQSVYLFTSSISYVLWFYLRHRANSRSPRSPVADSALEDRKRSKINFTVCQQSRSSTRTQPAAKLLTLLALNRFGTYIGAAPVELSTNLHLYRAMSSDFLDLQRNRLINLWLRSSFVFIKGFYFIFFLLEFNDPTTLMFFWEIFWSLLGGATTHPFIYYSDNKNSSFGRFYTAQ